MRLTLLFTVLIFLIAAPAFAETLTGERTGIGAATPVKKQCSINTSNPEKNRDAVSEGSSPSTGGTSIPLGDPPPQGSQ